MILVTGATGFVGTSLARELRERGIGFRAASPIERNGIEPVGGLALAPWSQLLADVEQVVHLAAPVHVMKDTESDPGAAFRAITVDTTMNLARQEAGARGFSFVNSTKVNGEATESGQPFMHENVPNPQDVYSKLEAERALLVLGREAGLAIVVVQLSLVSDPGGKGNFAIMLSWVRRGTPVEADCSFDHPSVETCTSAAELAESCGRSSRHAVAFRALGNLQVDTSFTKQALTWRAPFQGEEAFRISTNDAGSL